MKKVAVYARRSEEKETGESIQNQLNICKRYAENYYKDASIDEYFDDDYSGRNMNRPEFSKLMKLVKKGYYQSIIFWKLDRVARNALDFLALHKELEKIGVNLVSVTEGFDPSTPAGKLMMTMLAAVAEMERKNISQRVATNMNEMAKQGRWTGGTVPFGFKVNSIEGKKYLIEDENNIKIASKLFKKYLEEESLYTVSKWLKANYAINKQPTSIKRILQNLVYVQADNDIYRYLQNKGIVLHGELNNNGLLSYGKTNNTKEEGMEFREESEWIVSVAKHKGVITGAEYIHIQKTLEKKTNSGRRGTGEVTYLNGLCRCAYCKGYMRTKQKKNPNGSIYRYFACGNRDSGRNDCKNIMVKISDVEETVLDKLYHYKVGSVQVENDLADTSILKADLDKKKRQIKNLVMKISLDEELEDIFLEQIKELKNEVTEIEKSMDDIERQNLMNDVDSYNREAFLDNLKNFKDLFERSVDVETKRKLVKSLVKRVNIDGLNKIIELDPYF
ncbi:recombinase family protein [Clostridium tunisiense]|uniref:recombinase family protein n=1 Tax=Clostridium tunisiense TaxID=219748 RepID=UPI00031F9473|nr:recombinase family protein [Clostridium tunisiense]